MKKQLIRKDISKYKNIINEYKEFLYEERGISSDVQKETEYLSELIQDEIKRNKTNI